MINFRSREDFNTVFSKGGVERVLELCSNPLGFLQNRGSPVGKQQVPFLPWWYQAQLVPQHDQLRLSEQHCLPKACRPHFRTRAAL